MAGSAKSFLADAGYGEQELDANSALMGLDKGGAERGCLSWRAAVRAVELPLSEGRCWPSGRELGFVP